MGLSAININNQMSNMQPAKTGAGVFIADQAITVTNAVTDMNPTAYDADTTHIFWTLDGADARVTFDNSNPSGTNGHFIADKSSGLWKRELAEAAQWFRDASTDSTLHISEMQGA